MRRLISQDFIRISRVRFEKWFVSTTPLQEDKGQSRGYGMEDGGWRMEDGA